MLDCPGNSSLAEDPDWDATRATTRDVKIPLVHGDACGNVELGQVQRKLDQNIKQRCCNKQGAGQNGKKWALVRHGPDWARKTSPGITSRRGQETQQHVSQGQQSYSC